jgi:hypothetical protein
VQRLRIFSATFTRPVSGETITMSSPYSASVSRSRASRSSDRPDR